MQKSDSRKRLQGGRMSGLVRLLVMAVAALVVAGPASYAAPARPNIIVVLADDLGFGDLGAYGATRIRTPHLNRMAREGALLTSFFASANVCTPSRAGLLTGRYAVRSGLAVGVLQAHSTYGLPESEITLPELLRDAGYRTAMLGKWHLGSRENFWPMRHGFDYFWGVPWSNDMTPFPLYRGTTIIEEPTNQETFATRLADEARAVIAAPSDKPFFLYIAHIAPHVPLRPGPAFRGKSKAGLYGDFVEEMDWTMGEVFAALRESGKDRDTIVIFTSDNGPWFEGSSGGLRDRKGSTFEGAFGVPFIARWPAGIPRGVRSDQMAMNIDLLPTLAALAGAKTPTDRVIDGQNIAPLLTTRAASTPHEKLFFFSNAEVAAVRTQDWRLVVRTFYQTFDVPLDRFNYRLLFDMKADRGETESVWALFPKVAAQLEAMIVAARKEFAGLVQQKPLPAAGAPIQLPGETRPPPPQPSLPNFSDQPPMNAGE
jgi:arylsulfatase A